nr:cytochrome P450 [Mesorhizobium alhagi]
MANLPFRYATQDAEIDGCAVRRGDAVLMAFHAANRDEKAFGPGADRFDITRRHNLHLSFGQGPHFCLGRCAGAPGIALRLPRAVRAAGGSGFDHRRGGRRLHAVLRHSLPAAPAGHLPPFRRLESQVPPCPNNPCRRCRCGASITSSPRPRCWRYAPTVRSTACASRPGTKAGG